MVKVKIEPYVVLRTEVLHYEINLPRSLFSPLVCDAQCCEPKIHFALTSGKQPLPMKNSKSLKVSLSALGFFQEGSQTH